MGYYYDKYLREIQQGISPTTTKDHLIQLLEHCKENVPYYSRIMKGLGESYINDPLKYLESFPVLTKEIIRENFDDLKTKDLSNRNWFITSSGGSTGEPVKVIHDYEFAARASAIQQLFSYLTGREIGESEVYLWGSHNEIVDSRENWKLKLANYLTNTVFFNVFSMSNQMMQEIINYLNHKQPKLIIAYAESITEIARFIEKENIKIRPQNAIITSADTLFPSMREKIEKVFQCKVFNRYGSREIGNIACERPGIEGLWVAPWGNYVEVLDNNKKRVTDGEYGEFYVTSLMNYSMPMIRYKIEDYGALMENATNRPEAFGQLIKEITGRTVNLFRTENGYCHPGYFFTLLFDKPWIKNYQIIQKTLHNIILKIVLFDQKPPPEELDTITSQIRMVFGSNCQVNFDFVEKIETSKSGKYLFAICEI